MRGSAVASRSIAPTITALARVACNCGRNFGCVKKLRSPGPALTSVASRLTSVAGSPMTSPPRLRAMSASRYVFEPGTRRSASLGRFAVRRRLRILQRLDDLVGNVDLGTRPHDLVVLEHDVQLVGLRHLADHLVRTRDDARELLIAARVQIFAKFALLALEFAIRIVEFTLPTAALGFRHRHAVLVQALLQALDLVGSLGQFLVALGELRL